MAAVTDAEMLVLYNEALQAIAKGQSYEINGRRMTRVDAKECRAMVEWLENRIARAGASNPATAGFGLASFDGPA